MKIYLLTAIIIISNSIFAQDKFSQPPFNVPDGYIASGVLQESEFDVFKGTTTHHCYSAAGKAAYCKASNYGFDEDGRINVEGTIKSVTYKKTDDGRIPKLLLHRNYLAVVESLGGKRHAFIQGDDQFSVFLIEKQGQKIWIQLYTESYGYRLTTVTSGGFKSILTAGKFAEEIKKQGYITLNVNFDTNKSVIKDQDKPTLNEVVILLKNDPALKLSVDGHTDNVGNAAANKTLSQQRSESIVKHLTSNGVAPNRLVAKGFGSESPVADNRSEEGKAKNRRVELVKF